MKVKYGWDPDYPIPECWDARTPLHQGVPKFFHLYQDLNDKKLRFFLNKLKGKTLDAGCGDGRFIAYADVGVDFSRGMLKRAKSRHQNRNFVRASILHLPFQDKAFSAAFTVDVLLHIKSEERKDALKEIDRVADNSYSFLAEHRTVTPFIFQLLRTISLKSVWRIIPYIAVFFAFPLDMLKKLKIDSTSQVLRKLEA
jgi:ubiquinone/menaquinone biosynthesis C-methylase UbiE